MKTIICKFKSDGTVIRKTAVINDTLDALSKSKRNEATDIIEPDTLDFEGWCIYFEITDTLAYEVMFVYDQENGIKASRMRHNSLGNKSVKMPSDARILLILQPFKR